MAHTARSGVAIVANDMHLSIGVPIIWYRASMVFPDPVEPSASQRITGVTLPGIPGLVVGSNGHVAWGFTNSGGDWSDLVRIEPDPRDPKKYLTPDGPKPFDVFERNDRGQGRAVEDGADPLDDLGTDRVEGRARPRVRAALGRA